MVAHLILNLAVTSRSRGISAYLMFDVEISKDQPIPSPLSLGFSQAAHFNFETRLASQVPLGLVGLVGLGGGPVNSTSHGIWHKLIDGTFQAFREPLGVGTTPTLLQVLTTVDLHGGKPIHMPTWAKASAWIMCKKRVRDQTWLQSYLQLQSSCGLWYVLYSRNRCRSLSWQHTALPDLLGSKMVVLYDFVWSGKGQKT